jgi:hypothetical protein
VQLQQRFLACQLPSSVPGGARSTHFYALQIIIGKISPAIGDFDEAAGVKVEFALESGSVTYPTLP